MSKKNVSKYHVIIDAAVVVIAENGFEQTQIAKIAKEAGIADGTIYLYFKNKEDLLLNVFREKMGQFIESIENEIAEITTTEKKLSTLINMHFRQLSDDYHLAMVTQLELRQSNKGLRARIGEVLKRYLAVIDNILKQGMVQGVFDEALDIRLARQMIFGTIDETATNWVLNNGKYDLVGLADSVNHMLIHGLKR